MRINSVTVQQKNILWNIKGIQETLDNHEKKVSFGRMFASDEMEEARTIATKARELLGLNGFDIIIQGPDTSPSKDDWGIGLPNSSHAVHDGEQLSSLGFNYIIKGPPGTPEDPQYSPYTAPNFSKNRIVDLSQLADKEGKWGGILSEGTFRDIVDNAPNGSHEKTNYDYALKSSDRAVREAYINFVSSNDPKLVALKARFEEFKTRSADWLNGDAEYEVRAKIYNNYDYKQWPKDSVPNINPEDVEIFKFNQFVVSEQGLEIIEGYKKNGMHLIGDRQVSYSHRDVYANQHLFYKDWCLGCPPDCFAVDGQSWGFALLHPRNLFVHRTNNLSESGLFMKKVYKNLFEQSDRIRIDHAIGLIDPWIYPAGKLALEGHRAMFYEVLREKYGLSVDLTEADLENAIRDNVLDELASKTNIKEVNRADFAYDFMHSSDPWEFKISTLVDLRLRKDTVYESLKEHYGFSDSKLNENELKRIIKDKLVYDFINNAKTPIDGPYDLAGQIVYGNDTNAWKLLKTEKVSSRLSLELTDKISAKYSAVIENIVLPAAREAIAKKRYGHEDISKLSIGEKAELESMVKKAIIFEDLGSVTEPVKKIFKDLNLPGILHARYADPLDPKHMYRERNNTRGGLLQVGSHDDATYLQEIDDMKKKGTLGLHLDYLAGELKIERSSVLEDPIQVMLLKIARLLLGANIPGVSNEVGMHWQDLMGQLLKNQRYNTPGTSGSHNWTNRMPKDWFELLCNKLIPNGETMNPLRALQMALAAKDGVDAGLKAQILGQLRKFAQILEEKATKIV